MTVTPEFGILFLGIFVGAILGFGLAKAGGNLKAALTVLGASLGGGPILFIDEVAAARWMYPVGLVIGLAWLRILAVRVWLEGRAQNPARTAFAWLDMTVIVGVTVAAAAYAFVPG